MNHKKLRRLYDQERLQVRRRGGRKRAVGTRAPLALPSGPHQRWSLDFVSDALGRWPKVPHSCGGRRLHPRMPRPGGRYLLARHRVVREVEALVSRHGRPLGRVSDNDTELTSLAMLKWAQDARVEWHYIAPGKPQQNAFIESFNDGSGTSASTRRSSRRSATRAAR